MSTSFQRSELAAGIRGVTLQPASLHQSNSWLARPDGECSGWSAEAGSAGRSANLPSDEHLLNDIGLTREEALDEAAKPFWR